MSKQLRYIIFLFIVIIAAAPMAIAAPTTTQLAERTAPGSPATTTTTTSTTTTTTLPIVPRCPDGIAGAKTGSQSGYNYWAFNDGFCNDQNLGGPSTVYCFENPQVDVSSKQRVDWEDIIECFNNGGTFLGCSMNGTAWNASWEDLAAAVTAASAKYPDTCFICGCFRTNGCFAPGVKITMADGSLRNVEDVRAGDLVQNAKTGAPVRVGKVIEGPEALPLIHFGFEGTTVTTSQAHPVLTAAGLKPASQLEKGDVVFDAQGDLHALTILETLPVEEGQRVINFNLDAAPSDTDERLIISDGIITGDIVLQGLLKDRR